MKSVISFLVLLIAVIASGCAAVYSEPVSLSDLDTGSVLLVGRIELVPPLSPEEQQIDMGIDPLNVKSYHMGRAIMFLSDRPVYQDHTSNAINPPLEQTWFIAIPASQRYMVRGSITMDYSHRAVDRNTTAIDQTELLIPGPIEFDTTQRDRSIYVGTLRLHRDEFHSVTKAEIVDDYATALSEFRKRFGDDASLRKSLLKPVMAEATLNR